jgi:hypothetical protein
MLRAVCSAGEEVSWMRKTSLEGARTDLTAHAALYVLVMAALVSLNLSLLNGFWWSVIPLVIWGVVLGLHSRSLRRMERAARDPRTRPERTTATARPAA